MKFRKVIFTCLMALAMALLCLCILPQKAEAATSDTCGDNLTWALDSQGTLTISGTGSMTEFLTGSNPSYAPWYASRAAIKKVIIQQGVTSVGRYAFASCSNLTSITIPSSVTSIGESFASTCYKLSGIWVDANNRYYSNDTYGVLFNKTKTRLILAPARSLSSYYIIPDTVTTIEAFAFEESTVSRIEIPNSLKTINNYAFLSCNALKTVIMPDSITEIGYGLFENCSYSEIEIWFAGSESQKDSIAGIEELANCSWHYDCCESHGHNYDVNTSSAVCVNCGYICAEIYKNACDIDCDFCGRIRQVPDHIYDNACDTTCNSCNYERAFLGHVYTDANDLICNVCKQTLAPKAPTLETFTDTTVRLSFVAGYEYSIDGVNWQISNIFQNLSPAETYIFYQRVAESNDNFVSPASAGLTVTTDKFTPIALAAPTVQSNTDTTVTLTAILGCEYSMDGENWQQSSTFVGLEAATQYTFYQRIAETDVNYASPNSQPLKANTRARTGKVTYNANGGKNAPAAQFKAEGMALVLTIDEPNYTGHIFMGWAVAPYKNVMYQPGSSYNDDADTMLYAMWLPECSGCNGVGKVTEKCPRCLGDGTRADSAKSRCCGAGVIGGLAIGGDPGKIYCLMCSKPCSVDYTTVSCPKTITSTCDVCDGRRYSSQKLDNDYTPPVAVLESKTNISVTLVGDPCFQYSKDNINWQDSPIFTGLEPNTNYLFYLRYKETSTLYASAASEPLSVTTENSKSKPAAPVVSSYTDNKVTLVPISGGEYSMDGEVWQSSNVFKGLSPVTKYTFYQRYAAVDDLWPSISSNGTSVTTDKSKQTLVPNAPTVQSFTSDSIILTPVDGCEYSKDGATWQLSNIFSDLLCGTEYTFYQRYNETATTYAGKSSEALVAKTDKGIPSKPFAPTLSSKTYNSVTLEAWSGYEYSRDGINWQSSNIFTGLDAETNYMFYQRKAETATYYASEASTELTVKTDEAPACVANPELHIFSSTCDTDCNLCGAVRKITHDFADATCTTPKTCKVCFATQGEPLPHKYTELKFDEEAHWNQCACGAIDETSRHGHNFVLFWGGVDHWQQCLVCGAEKDRELHDFDPATCEDPMCCKVCGTIEGEALGHTYTNDCDTSCNRCGAKRSIKHKYTNECDKYCNVCKAKRTAPHKYTNSCDTKCNLCKTKRTIKHTYSNGCDKTCNVCKAKRTTSHKYKTVTTRATLTRHGKVEKKCSVCGYVSSKTTIRYAKTIKLSATSYTYNGKVKTPTVTVKDSAGKTLKKNTDYTVSYSSGRKNVGTYKVTIKFKGKYSGTKVLTFKINPKAASINKLTAKTKGLYVKLNRQTVQSTGYEIQYSTAKSFKSAKAVTTGYKTSTKAISGLKGRTTYYVRVRTYKTVSGVKYYSNWSTAKYMKTK